MNIMFHETLTSNLNLSGFSWATTRVKVKTSFIKYLSLLGLRFSNLFYLFVNNSNTPNISKFLQALRLKNYHIAFVSDVIYHKRTVHSLNKNNFISVGPLPLTLSFYTLSFSIPVATNSLVSNTFFLRLVLKVKSQNSFSFFNRRKLHWNSIDGT